jgi:hypothetical protein
MKIYKYNKDSFPFQEYFRDLYGLKDLSQIHSIHDSSMVFDMSNNSDTLLHKMFYTDIKSEGSEFTKLYNNFINTYVRESVGFNFIYQKLPTLRLHFDNNWATPEFHVDTQDGYFHPHGEINFIVPVTECFGNNSVWIESEPSKGDYHPVKMQPGDLLSFSGGTCKHGNKMNDTSKSRISFDFRIMPLSKYDPTFSKSSATRSTKFIIGEYYKELK